MLKLKILDKEHDLLNIKSIKSDLSMITIEDKGKGLILLISKDIKEDISTRYGKEGKSENLINILSDYLVAPSYIIQLSPAISTEVYTIIQPQVSVDDNHWNIRLNLYS